MINKIIANDLGVVMEIQKFTNNATTSAGMLRRYQDMIVENQGEEDLEEANDDNEDQVDEAQEEVEEGKLPPGLQAHIDAKNDKEVDEAKDEDEKEEVKEEIPSTSMLRRYQDMIKEAEKEDEEVDESKEEEVDEEVDEGVTFTTKYPKGGSKKLYTGKKGVPDSGYTERTTTGSGKAKTERKGLLKGKGADAWVKEEDEMDEGVKRTPRDAYDRKVVKPAHEFGKGVGKYSSMPEFEKDLADFPGMQKSLARKTARGRISDGGSNPRHGGTGVGVPRG